uniref:nitrous oxide-stimulated promoter family protein n=1 Tax=uncultured Dysgonomonas sp. TaxID=206096 RepID=UPI00262A22AA|nr:nitrous oxide-stimulated promoter family protein [uncultured Dysgonomonas sp.]
MNTLESEKITVSKMIAIYCRNRHNSSTVLCEECRVIKDYAYQQLNRCRFGNDKPTCEKCPIHCYKITLRKKMQIIMRYSGPRMIIYHPISAIKHLIHNMKRKAPEKKSI